MPEWFTPLLRVLVAIPSLGNCSTRKTSCQRLETALAMAQPITPPPIIRMLAWSINPFYSCALFMDINFIEKRFAFDEARLRAIVNRIHRVLFFLVMIAPERGRAVDTVFVQRVEKNVKGREFSLVVFVVARDARHRFEARVCRRFALAHHFDDGMATGNLDVFLALARRTRRAHFIVHAATCANDR